MILIYANTITPRVSYIFDHVFTNLLHTEFKFTSQVNDFVAYSGAKFSYSGTPLGEEIHIQSHNLLFEQGINDVEIDMGYWERLPCFFMTTSRSIVPFDLFAASFFLLSRYEECRPSIRDKHNRYNYKDSIAFKNGFLNIPLVDMWAQKFKELLQSHFLNLTFKISKPGGHRYLIDISELYAFKYKGFFRNIGGAIMDIKSFDFRRVWHRCATLMGVKKDPYDLIDSIISIHKENEVPIEFFVLTGDFGVYDKAISFRRNGFRSYIKSIADYYGVYLLVSHENAFDKFGIETERDRLQHILRRNISGVRFHFDRLRIPASYQNLVELEFERDYSMGYHDTFGFRAGTCTPFMYYDPMYEIKCPLEVYPFCVHRRALIKNDDTENQISYYKDQVKQVGGTFISVMSNSYLSKLEHWEKFYKMLIR